MCYNSQERNLGVLLTALHAHNQLDGTMCTGPTPTSPPQYVALRGLETEDQRLSCPRELMILYPGSLPSSGLLPLALH